MRQDTIRLGTGVILVAVLVGAAWAQIVAADANSDADDSTGLQVAKYTAAEELIFPSDTERWVFLGATIGGDYSDAEFDPKHPGRIGIVKIEPSAYDYLLKNKRYADGTMILLSFFETQEKPNPNLNGFVQDELAAREIHVIDRSMYEDQRAFFMFAGDASEPSAMLPPGNECVQCHNKHGDFDSTFTQFYPSIRQFVSDGKQRATK